MGFTKWTELQNLDYDAFDEADVEAWVPLVVSADVGDEEDPKRLKALLNLSKVLLEVKAAQAEIALDELEHLTGRKSNVIATREQRLTIENNNLKEKLAASLAAYSDSQKSLFVLKEELQELREQNQQLALEYDELHSEMISDKEAVTKSNAKIEHYEKEVQSLSQERNELMANLRDTQRQLESQEDVDILARKFELNELQLKIRSQNQEVLKMLEDLNALTETNDMYQRQIRELKDSLKESVVQMELAADECLQLKTTNEQLGRLVDGLQAENNELRDQMNHGGASPIQKADEHMMSMVDEKIDEWKFKRRLDDKDQELNECKARIAVQEADISRYKPEGERMSLSALRKVLLEREEQVECLKNALKEATREMESNASLIEGLNSELRSENQVAIVDLRRQLRFAEMEIRSLRRSQEESEMARIEKERQLADLLSRLRQFEQGEYGLEEAVSEIYLLNKRLTIRNEQLYELIQHCNLVELNLAELWDENSTFRERLKLERRAPLNLDIKTIAHAFEDGIEPTHVAGNGQIDQVGAELTVLPEKEKEAPSPELQEKQAPTRESLFPILMEAVDKEVPKEIVSEEDPVGRTEPAPMIAAANEEPKLDAATAQTEWGAVEEMETATSTISAMQADLPALAQLSDCVGKLAKELEGKKKQLERLNLALTVAKQKLGSLSRQHTLKCEELAQCREAIEKERLILEETINDQRTEIEMANVKVTELEATIEVVNKGDKALIKQKIVEVTRQQILTRLENVRLKRRLLVLERSLKAANNEHAKLKAGANELRSALSRKRAFFEKRQKVSIYKIASLRRKLGASVPAAEFQQLEAQFKELFQKYANRLLDETSSAVVGLESKNVEDYKAEEESMQIVEKSGDDFAKSWSMLNPRYPYEQQDSDDANESEELEVDNSDEVIFDENKQLETLRIQQAVEIEQLRAALNDFMCKTDRNMQIGQLHCEILSLKLAGIDKDNKIKEAQDLNGKMENMKRAMEDNLKRVKKAKSSFLQRENTLIGQINELKKNLRESIPLKMAEKFHTIGNSLLHEQRRLAQKSKEVEAKTVEADDRADALSIRERILEKLVSSIENEEQRNELVTMSGKLERLKVENSKLNRLVKRLEKEDVSNRGLIHSLKENIFKLARQAKSLDTVVPDSGLIQAIQEYDILRRTSSPRIEDEVEAVINKEADWVDEEIDRLKLFIKSKLKATSQWKEQTAEKIVSPTSSREIKRDVHDRITKESFVDSLAPLLREKIVEREDRFDSCGKRIQALEEEVAFLRAQYNIILAPPDEVETGNAEALGKKIKERVKSPNEHAECEQKIEKYRRRIVELEETVKLKEKEITELKESAARWQSLKKESEAKRAEQLSTGSAVSEEAEGGSEAPDEAVYERPESVRSVHSMEEGMMDENRSSEPESYSEQHSSTDVGSSPKMDGSQSPMPPARVEIVPLEVHLKLKLEWERLKQAYRQLQLDNRKLVKALGKLKEEFMKTAVAQKFYGMETKGRQKVSSEIEDHPQDGETALPDAANLESEYLNVKRKLVSELKEIRLGEVTRAKISLSDENKRLKSEIVLLKSSATKSLVTTAKKFEKTDPMGAVDSESRARTEEFEKWVESKKWQTMYESEKAKVANKEKDIAKLKKVEGRLRSRITRLERYARSIEPKRAAEEICAPQEATGSLLKAQDNLASSPLAKDAAISTQRQKGECHATLIRETAEEAEKTVESLENKVKELFKVIESKNQAEERYLEKQKRLEKRLRESEKRAQQLEKSLQASIKVFYERSARDGAADKPAIFQEEPKDGRGKEEGIRNYLKQKVTIKNCTVNNEFQNPVNMPIHREDIQPWLSTRDSRSLINKLIRENNIVRERLSNAQIQLEEAYKDVEYYKASHMSPSMGTWRKGSDILYDKHDVTSLLKDEKGEQSRVNALQELLKKEIEEYHKLKIGNERLNRKIEALDAALHCDSFMENQVLQSLKIVNFELMEEIDSLRLELEVYKKLRPTLTGNDALVDIEKLKERGKIYDRILRENVQLKLELSLARHRA